jgi:enediyne biosynthesis protein E4
MGCRVAPEVRPKLPWLDLMGHPTVSPAHCPLRALPRRHPGWCRFWTPVAALALLAGCGESSGPNTGSSAAPPPTLVSGPGPTAAAIFADVTKSAGVDFVHQLADGKLDNIMESDGAGGVFFDFDGDGFLDIYLVNSGPAPVLSDAPPGTPRWPNRLYRNRGDGTFEDVTRRAGVEGHGFGTTAAAADYDNDGFPDLLVVNFDGLILYHNERNGTFTDVTEKAGLISKQPGISATFLDADGDGYLDVFVANYLRYDPAVKVPPGTKAPYPGPLSYEPEVNLLYHNRGDGTFADISEAAGIRIAGHRAMSVAAFDCNLDGAEDLYVSNDGTPNLLFANDGQGHFTEVGLKAGASFNQFGAADGSMGAAVGDVNGDGLPDLFVTRFGNASLYLNSRGGFFEDRIQPSGILAISSQYTGWGGNFLDFDNDGDLDLFIANGDAHYLKGMPPLVLENRGDGSFTDASATGGPLFKRWLNARGSGAWDFDNDGRMDLLITTLGDRTVLWRNVGPSANHWLTLRLEGARGNRDGFGAQVRLTAGGRTLYAEARCPTSYVFQQDPRLHFGLGTSPAADRIELRWPGGQTQTLTNVAADRILQVTEPGPSRWTPKR